MRRVKGVKQLGSRTGNWLTRDQARMLLETADGGDLRSLRDLAMISVLLGCGLRRAELSALKADDLGNEKKRASRHRTPELSVSRS
jgi:site-specific recombinase XerD